MTKINILIYELIYEKTIVSLKKTVTLFPDSTQTQSEYKIYNALNALSFKRNRDIL